jgi:hypothetical protein
MTELFEPDAVVDIGGGTYLRGKEAIHEFFTKLQVTGFGPEKREFEFGEQRPALIAVIWPSPRRAAGMVP